MLHNINHLKGSIVSVTTDGFITNIENLEEKLMNLPDSKIELLNIYKNSRGDLSGNSTGLEIKKEGIGIMSWTTRGQFSKESSIMAATGFQKSIYSMNEIEELFKNTMNSKNKEIVYLHHRLRSALDIFKNGGHVTSIYKDQIFRMFFDNRRVIQEKEGNTILDSKPVKDVNQAELYRFLGKLPKNNIYQKNTSIGNSYKNSYKDMTDIAVRSFIRNLLSGELNLDKNKFKNYTEIATFVNNYNLYIDNKDSKDSEDSKNSKNKMLNFNANIIAQLKRRSVRPKIIIKNKSTEQFVEYIKETFPNFDSDKFYNNF